MNFLLDEKTALLIKSGQANPIILSNFNSSILASGSNGLAFEITNNVGKTVKIIGLILKYDSTFDNVLIELYNTQANQRIMTGNTLACNVGQPKNLNYQNSIFPIVPFGLDSGQFVQFFVNNVTANPLPVRGISLSLFGLQ